MSDDQNVNYGSMYTPEPAPTESVFGATANVDGTELVYDETNELWVFADNHDEIWTGETPATKLDEDVPVDAEPIDFEAEVNDEDTPADSEPIEVGPELAPVAEPANEVVEPVDISGDCVVGNLKPGGALRLRKTDAADSEIVALLAPGTPIRILEDSNPEWAFVDSTVDGSTVRGYVMKSFVVSV